MRFALVVLAFALVSGCGDNVKQPSRVDGNTPTIDAAPPEPAPSVQFAVGSDDLANGTFTDNFVTGNVGRVHTLLTLPAEPGLSFARLDLLTPSGAVFKRSYLAFSTEADAPRRAQHPVLPFDVRVQKVELDADGYVQVLEYIPLRGSLFHRRGMSGVYGVQVFLGSDRAESAIAANYFTLQNTGGGQ